MPFLSNEEKVLKNLSRSYSKENYKPSVSTEKEEIITEGLKVFKTSKRLYKLADKIAAKAKNNPALAKTAKKLSKLGNEFEKVEDLYYVGKKAEAKIKYKQLNSDYEELIKLLKKEDTKNALKGIGFLATTIAAMTIPYMALNKFFPKLAFGAVNKAALGAPVKDQIGLYLKRAGAFTLCGLPIKAVNMGLNSGLTEYEDQIVKSVDRLLQTENA